MLHLPAYQTQSSTNFLIDLITLIVGYNKQVLSGCYNMNRYPCYNMYRINNIVYFFVGVVTCC